MRKACMMISLIFGILGIFGGGCNLAGGACGAASLGVSTGVGAKTEEAAQAEVRELAEMSAKGVVAAFCCAFALIFGVIVGNSKSTRTAVIFSVLLIGAGVIATVFTNYFSGPMLSIAGLIGIFGARNA